MCVHLVSGQKTRIVAYLLVHKHLNKLILQKSSDKEKVDQESVQQVIESVRQIVDLPPEGQVIALAKLIEKNPGIPKQLEKLSAMLESLYLLRRTTLTALPAKEPAE